MVDAPANVQNDAQNENENAPQAQTPGAGKGKKAKLNVTTANASQEDLEDGSAVQDSAEARIIRQGNPADQPVPSWQETQNTASALGLTLPADHPLGLITDAENALAFFKSKMTQIHALTHNIAGVASVPFRELESLLAEAQYLIGLIRNKAP